MRLKFSDSYKIECVGVAKFFIANPSDFSNLTGADNRIMTRGSSEMSHVDNQLPLYDGSVITSQLTASLNSVIDCRAPIVIILISLLRLL